jgi:hypothetical protein
MVVNAGENARFMVQTWAKLLAILGGRIAPQMPTTATLSRDADLG